MVQPLNAAPNPEWLAGQNMRAIARAGQLKAQRAPGTAPPLDEALAAVAPPSTATPPLEPKKFVTPNPADSSLAEALLGQANSGQPIETPLELMGRLAQSYTGNKLQRDAEQKKLDSYKSLSESLIGPPPAAPADGAAPATAPIPRPGDAYIRAGGQSGNMELIKLGASLNADAAKNGVDEWSFGVLPDGTEVKRNKRTGQSIPTGRSAPKPDEPTADEKGYARAVKEGYSGSFTDYQIMLKRAGVANQESKSDEALGTGLGNDAMARLKGGDAGWEQLSVLNKMEAEMNDPAFFSGAGSTQLMWAKKAAVSLGIADPDSVSSMESFSALSKNAALKAMGGSLGTGFSNADRDFVEQQVPTTSNTPEGNKRIISVQRAVAQRKIEVADITRKYIMDHGGHVDVGLYETLNQYARENPVFKDIPAAGPEATPALGPTNPSAAAPATLPPADPSVRPKGIRPDWMKQSDWDLLSPEQQADPVFAKPASPPRTNRAWGNG